MPAHGAYYCKLHGVSMHYLPPSLTEEGWVSAFLYLGERSLKLLLKSGQRDIARVVSFPCCYTSPVLETSSDVPAHSIYYLPQMAAYPLTLFYHCFFRNGIPIAGYHGGWAEH